MMSADLSACTGIYELREGLMVLEDGSVAAGYRVEGSEDEALEGEGYRQLIGRLEGVIAKMRPGVMLQQLDSYYEAPCPKTGRTVIRHQALLYLIVPAKKKTPTPFNTFLASSSHQLQVAFEKLEETMQETCKEARTLERAFTAPPYRLQRLTDEENLSQLYAYFNLDFSGRCRGLENTMVALPAGLQLGDKAVRIVSMKSQAPDPHYWAHNGLGHGKGVTSPFTWNMSHYLPFPHIIVQAVQLEDTEALLSKRSEALEWSAGAQRKERALRHAESAQEDLATFETTLRAQGGVMSTLNYLVILYHPDATVLSERVELVKKEMRRWQAHPLVETYDTTNLFFAGMPAGGLQLYRGLPMPLETALAYMNTITPRKGSEEGVLLADRHGTPLCYDPFNTALDNQNAFVFGPSGSGKSFLNGKLIKERYGAGHVVLVIDSGGTYRRLFEVLGGQYIEYLPEKPLSLNPFLIKKTGKHFKPSLSKVNFLVQLVGKMWKGDLNKHPLSEAEKALLSKWIPAYYQKEQGVPTLTGFYSWLEAYEGCEEARELDSLFPFQDFLVVLEPFARGIYKEHLNAKEATDLLEHPLICFELGAVKSHPKLYPLVVQILFELAFELVEKYPTKKKFIDVEEGWSMLDDYAEENIEAFFRKGRKTKTSIRLITQDIEEIKGSRIAGAMKNNASTVMLLYNEKESSRSEMGAFLGLTDMEMEKYESLRRESGYREVLIKEMTTAHVWRVEVSAYEHALLTSKPDERDRITALIQEKGNAELGIQAWIKERV